MEAALFVGAGGALGAAMRYTVSVQFATDRFPVSTLLVNVVGSFVLGLVTFLAAGDTVVLFVGIGACGSFTTYSSFSVEVVRLWDDGSRVRATIYALGTLLACLLAVGAGWGVVGLIGA